MRKRNAIVIWLGVLFAILGVIGLVLGYWLSGADIIAWFHSKWAITIGVVIMVDVVVVAGFYISDYIRRM